MKIQNLVFAKRMPMTMTCAYGQARNAEERGGVIGLWVQFFPLKNVF